jgi:hypothetical protein
MSDPRYTDPYRNDQSRRYDAQGFWPWLTTALTALGLIIGGIIGYNWGASHERTVLLNPPTTTGSAPSHQRPAPETR